MWHILVALAIGALGGAIAKASGKLGPRLLVSSGVAARLRHWGSGRGRASPVRGVIRGPNNPVTTLIDAHVSARFGYRSGRGGQAKTGDGDPMGEMWQTHASTDVVGTAIGLVSITVM